MNDRVLVATRKGLFTLLKTAAGWVLRGPEFLGDPANHRDKVPPPQPFLSASAPADVVPGQGEKLPCSLFSPTE